MPDFKKFTGFNSKFNSMNSTDAVTAMLELLTTLYDTAIGGIPRVDKPVEQMVEDYKLKCDGIHDAADTLIRVQLVGNTATGFVTGLGGLLVLPVTVSADAAGVLYSQIRMIAAIACMGEYDIRTNQVRSCIFACLAGRDGVKILHDAGIEVGDNLDANSIMKISEATITAVNRAVAVRLVTRFGTASVARLSRLVPVAGGVIGGGLDFVDTRIIATNAKKLFLNDKIDPKAVRVTGSGRHAR